MASAFQSLKETLYRRLYSSSLKVTTEFTYEMLLSFIKTDILRIEETLLNSVHMKALENTAELSVGIWRW
jgi:hypothetical protein